MSLVTSKRNYIDVDGEDEEVDILTCSTQPPVSLIDVVGGYTVVQPEPIAAKRRLMSPSPVPTEDKMYVLNLMCDSGDEVVPVIYIGKTSMTDAQLDALRNSTRQSRTDFVGTIPGVDPDADQEIDESVWVRVKKNDCDVPRLTITGTTEIIYAWY